MTENARTPSRAYLAGGFLLAVAYLLGPPALRTGPVFNVIGLSSIAAILIGVRLNHPPKRLPWHLFALGQAFFITGDVIAYNYMRFFDKPLPFPALSDVFYLAVYPCLIAGVVILARQRHLGRDVTSFPDALIVAIGASLISWFYLISPYAQSADLTAIQKIVSIAYPVMDLLLLMALVRLAVGPGHRGGAFYLLIAGATCLLVTDAIYGWLLANVPGGYTNGGLLDGGWAAFYILWAAAALHPTMGQIGKDEGAGEESRRRSLRLRLILLAVTSVVPPTVQVIESLRGRPSSPITGVLSATLFILVLVRMNGVLVDLHQLKETQRKLRQSQQDLRDALAREREGSSQLRQLDDMKNTFLSAVSHELRTPLTFILGTSSLLETRLDSIPKDDVAEMLGHTRRAAKKLQTLLDDLLDVERLRQGRMTLERSPVDLGALAAEVVDDLGALEDHELIVDVPHLEILADRSKLERVLTNLVTNAFKYCPTGSRIWMRTEQRDDHDVVLIVEDEGPGIADADREVVFDAFKRVAPGTGSGTGIGLLLVAKFAEMHGGRAWVEDRPGGGASFHVSLPKAAEDLPGETELGSAEDRSLSFKGTT